MGLKVDCFSQTVEALCSLSTTALKEFLTSRKVRHDDCLEKSDLIRRAHESVNPHDFINAKDLCSLSSAELKGFISSHGMHHDDCIEKSDLIRRAHEAAASSNRAPGRAGRSAEGSDLVSLRAKTTSQLQEIILSAGLKYNDCKDMKDMLVLRAAHAKDRLTGRYNYKVGDGNAEALLLGTQIYNTGSHGGNIDAAFLRKIGGKESMKLIFDNFYQNMFADPRMIVLFGWRNTELPTAQHRRRLATFILQNAGLVDEYGRTDHDGFHHAHQQAKRCPMRPQRCCGIHQATEKCLVRASQPRLRCKGSVWRM